MNEISQLQLFKNTVQHKPSGQFLFYAHFTEELDKSLRKHLGLNHDMDLKDYFGMYNPVIVDMNAPGKTDMPDFSDYYKDVSIPSGSFINPLGVLEIPGSMHHFTQYVSPLRNAESFKELESFPYRDLSEYSAQGMADQVKKAHEEEKVAICYAASMYEDAWQIRGYERFLEDMLLEPEWCSFILDKIKSNHLIKVEAAAKAGVDIIMTGDDVANQRTFMFAPDLWRKFIKARWAEVYQLAKRIKPDICIWYHSDGNIYDIIPEMIEIGVDILNPIQPECMDVVQIKKNYGDRIVLDATIGTQTVMPFGTPDEVRKYVKERISAVGYDGALILAPTHILEPEVPVENVLAFVEAASGK